MGRYTACADGLRALAAAEPMTIHGSAHSIRPMLRTGAEACERLEESGQQLTQALQRVADLERLLLRVVGVLAAEPLPVEGGSWVVFELAQELRRALGPTKRCAP